MGPFLLSVARNAFYLVTRLAKTLKKLKDISSLITGFSRVDGTFLEALGQRSPFC